MIGRAELARIQQGVLGVADPDFFPDILEVRWGVYEDGRSEPWVCEVR